MLCKLPQISSELLMIFLMFLFYWENGNTIAQVHNQTPCAQYPPLCSKFEPDPHSTVRQFLFVSRRSSSPSAAAATLDWRKRSRDPGQPRKSSMQRMRWESDRFMESWTPRPLAAPTGGGKAPSSSSWVMVSRRTASKSSVSKPHARGCRCRMPEALPTASEF